MKKSVTVKVLKRHYDAAMKAAEGMSSVTTNCLVAKACQSAFPKKIVSVGYTYANVRVGKTERVYNLDSVGSQLVGDFDNRKRNLRKRLPVSIVLTLHETRPASASKL